MSVQWLFLGLAIAILLPPMVYPAPLVRALASSRHKPKAYALPALALWQNWLDFARAALGAYLLNSYAITVVPGASGDEFRSAAIKATILFLVIIVQTVRFLKGSWQVVAPIFFLCGLTAVFGGFLQGAFAVGVGWLIAFGGKSLIYQLPAMSLALGVAGYVLGVGIQLMLTCGLVLLPLVFSMLLQKKLTFAAVTSASA